MPIDNNLERVTPDLWREISLSWEAQSNHYEENFSDHAPTSMPVLAETVLGTPLTNTAAFAYKHDGEFAAILSANSAFIPNYSGRVLRIRHIVLSPKFELDAEVTVDDYGDVLVGVFLGSIQLSFDEMQTNHIKFHMRSPAERMFGEKFTNAMEGHGGFHKVAMKGSWIYLSKT